MKKKSIIVFGLVFLVFLYPDSPGCIAKVPLAKRGVTASNIFYSNINPKVMIKIDPSVPFLSLEEIKWLPDNINPKYLKK
jgi:hypothetical protein